MEYGLREKEGKLTLRGHLLVLILVLMEYGLRDIKVASIETVIGLS